MTEQTPLQRLAQIPDLAAEVEMTLAVGAPNPGLHTDHIRPSVPGSRPPTDIAALHASMPAERNGLRAELITNVQMITEEMADEPGRTAEIPDWPTDTWSGICEWLRLTSAWWMRQPWSSDVEARIQRVHAELRHLARVPREPTYRCNEPGCQERAHPQPGGQWMRCEAGHEVPGLGVMRQKLQDHPAMTAVEIHTEWGIAPGTLRRWKHEGRVQPVGQRGRQDLWPLWDVLTVQHAEQVGIGT